jgi:hypothetical protein
MRRHSRTLSATHTGMVINPTRAYPKIPGVDVVFPPFDVSRYERLQAALAHGCVDQGPA